MKEKPLYPQSFSNRSMRRPWNISAENAVNWSAHRLKPPQEPALWVPERREQNGIESLPVTEEAAAKVTKLPPLHKDPFDRMLVCQAISEGMTVVTPDPLIRQYPVRVFW